MSTPDPSSSAPETGQEAAASFQHGVELAMRGQFGAALACFDLAISLDPTSATSFNNRGGVLIELGRFEEAIDTLRRAAALTPGYADPLLNLGSLLFQLGRLDEAADSFGGAIKAQPTASQPLVMRARVLCGLDRRAEALRDLDAAAGFEPENADVFSERASVLYELGRHDAALADIERVTSLDPRFISGWIRRGVLLAELKRHDEAHACFDRAIALDPAGVDGHWNKALLYLATGDFAQGLPLFEWRWKLPDVAPHKRDFAQPQWNGHDDLLGRTLLLHSDQGLGDAIQFCRYAKLAADKGARVVIEVPPLIRGLLENVEGAAEVIGRGDVLPTFDFHCPMASAPLAFGTTVATIPATPAYLAAEPDRILRWGDRLATGQMRVGLLWSGSAAHAKNAVRSVPFKTLLAALCEGPRYVSLQRDLSETDRALLESTGILDVTHELDDFRDTAAFISQLDLVITVDTAFAHVAGALGIPTWLMLHHHPDWRWLQDRGDSPWYPSMRLFRQTKPGDWQPVMAEVTAALAVEVAQFSGDSAR